MMQLIYFNICESNSLSTDSLSPDVEASLEEAKALSITHHVQIYFISHYETPEDAAAIATTGESIHSVIHPRYLVEDVDGELIEQSTPYNSSEGPAVDYVDSFLSCLQSDREDKLIATVGKWVFDGWCFW